VLGTVLVAGCGSASGGHGTTTLAQNTPDGFVRHIYDLENVHAWAQEWRLLVPDQQQFIPRGIFIRCAASWLGTNPKVMDLQFFRTYKVPGPIPGAVDRSSRPITAVDERIVFADGGAESYTDKILAVNGHWRWISRASHSLSSFERAYKCAPKG
jgi:hypothetical protein